MDYKPQVIEKVSHRYDTVKFTWEATGEFFYVTIDSYTKRKENAKYKWESRNEYSCGAPVPYTNKSFGNYFDIAVSLV